MAQRIIKNYTNQDLTLDDLGSIVVPANGAADIGGDQQRLVQLAGSVDLLTALGQGINKYQMNDGNMDLAFERGINLILNLMQPTLLDPQGRWAVRVDSLPPNYDIVFHGAGDDIVNNVIGGGPGFDWDFSTEINSCPDAPEGCSCKKVQWQFIDGVYVKEGTLYFTNAPKGAFVDLYLICPPGYYYDMKWLDDNGNISWTYAQATVPTKFAHWVSHFFIEGSTPTGIRLATETSSDMLAPPYLIWDLEITAPSNATNLAAFHGFFMLQSYRGRTIAWPPQQ
jgi:hypothetical protein